MRRLPSQEACCTDVDPQAPLMERGVVVLARVVAQRDGQIELERLVTPEMAERMRREAEMAKVKAPGDVPASSKGIRLRGKEVSAVPHDRGAETKR